MAEGPAIPLTSVDGTLAHVAESCPFLCPEDGSVAAFGAVPAHMTALGELLFFVAADPDHGAEPWISDGTVEGTLRLADLCSGPCGSDPVPVGTVEGPDGEPRVVFWARADGFGRELWVSDGTPAGTGLLQDVCPGICSSTPEVERWWREPLWFERPVPDGALLDGELFFGSRFGVHATDGTVAGTRRVGTPCGSEGCDLEPAWLVTAGERIWFVYRDGEVLPGREGELRLASTDGTSVETHSTGVRPAARPPVPFGDGVAMLVGEPFTSGAQGCNDSPRIGSGTDTGIIGPVPILCLVRVTPEGSENLLHFRNNSGVFDAWQDRLVLTFPDSDFQIWSSDGTPGAEPLVTLPDATGGLVNRIVPAGDGLLYWGQDSVLWRLPAGALRSERLGEASLWELELVEGTRPLWVEPSQAVPPETGIAWSLRSWVGGTFQELSAPELGPGDVPRIELPPRMEVVGDKLFLSADAGDGHQLWVMDLADVDTGCLADPTAHCLRDGRFEVRVHFTDQHNGGVEGVATPVEPHESGDTGYFWFFRPDNLELAVKVLDGRPVNGHWWVFSGGSTDLEYTLEVRDRWTDEVRSYRHAPGDLCSVVDTGAFREDPVSDVAEAAVATAPFMTPLPAGDTVGLSAPITPVPAVPCTSFAGYECIGPDDRFFVQVRYTNQHAGNEEGTASPLDGTADSVFFRFFPNAGAETMIKVLDGRPVNGHWWVLWGGLTNLGYTVEVLDRETEAVRTFTNPVGSTCGGADTTAFAEAP